MHGLAQAVNIGGSDRIITRLTTKQAIVALRLLRMKVHTHYNLRYEEHIRGMFRGNENKQFFQATIHTMMRRTLSWDDMPGREDVFLAINLLLEFAKKDAKEFSYWNC